MARHNVIIRLRDPGQMISYIVAPMILMVVLKPLYVKAVDGGAVQVVTGLLVMFSVFAIAIAGSSILVERHWQTWDRLRQTRASAAEMLLGKIIPIFVVMVVQQSILIVYGCLVIGIPIPKSVGYMALAIAVWAFCLLAIGAALATLARSLGELGVISDVSAITLSSFGGALVPLSIMPGWAQAAAHASPGYWALQMMQAAIRGDGPGVLVPAGVLLGLGIVAGAFAVSRLTKGWGRTRLL
ncbi:ABC-2 type transport system permease protein [Allocatelliglobosispora scoriae]|uniref:Transport permease protein n=1 Tax=Allocatelliglobosispora scoriae TaxID=643052 RepID=A0A841C370_9ACTN|nr:ABC transporter permease [Allocatelliglobosispora scoriae]MBB5873492.1 ABC-2 type transport system permease protein [Allocatelliglobosispora scoriae]